MRELGLLGTGANSFDTKAADELFAILDKDHGGDLDFEEITVGLKELQANAKDTAVAVAGAKDEASFWRERAAALREAAVVVEAWDAIRVELEQTRIPSTEVKLGATLLRKNLKPVDIVAQVRPGGRWSKGGAAILQSSASIESVGGMEVLWYK